MVESKKGKSRSKSLLKEQEGQASIVQVNATFIKSEGDKKGLDLPKQGALQRTRSRGPNAVIINKTTQRRSSLLAMESRNMDNHQRFINTSYGKPKVTEDKDELFPFSAKQSKEKSKSRHDSISTNSSWGDIDTIQKEFLKIKKLKEINFSLALKDAEAENRKSKIMISTDSSTSEANTYRHKQKKQKSNKVYNATDKRVDNISSGSNSAKLPDKQRQNNIWVKMKKGAVKTSKEAQKVTVTGAKLTRKVTMSGATNTRKATINSAKTTSKVTRAAGKELNKKFSKLYSNKHESYEQEDDSY